MKTVIEMAREAGFKQENSAAIQAAETFAALVRADEREACAKVVEDSPSYDWHKFACETAFAIRARGQA
jgi:hypothetical protein